jgi:hypothetical protein
MYLFKACEDELYVDYLNINTKSLYHIRRGIDSKITIDHFDTVDDDIVGFLSGWVGLMDIWQLTDDETLDVLAGVI